MAEEFRFFGGIDFSGAREPLNNLWSAVGVEADGRLRILDVRPHAFRVDLANYVAGGWREPGARAGRILWGADFPFGIPAAVATAVGAGEEWDRVAAWIADRPADEVRDAAAAGARTPRATDTGGALAPLDLRLFKQTVEGIRWLHELKEEGEISIVPQALQPGGETTLIEVYPSGTAQELGLPRRRAPSRPGEARARAAALRTYLDFSEPVCEATAVTLEDAWDATLACLTAFLCRADLEQPARAAVASQQQTRREGWIFRPPATLA
jgi:uncharacterized protein YbaA (DUF1428 family)